MKITFLSDLHGNLPTIKKCDVVCVAGDIIPIDYQWDVVTSVTWFTGKFVKWAEKIKCEKVIFIGGNHDVFLEKILKEYFEKRDKIYTIEDQELMASAVLKYKLMLPEKIVYLQDTEYSFNHVKFYGTPWIPDLSGWAFYKSHDDLERVFAKIPDDCDVLITHAPGTECDMGTSLWISGMPMYGCQELNDRVVKTNIKFWAAGHVHTGNHKINVLSNGVTRFANVSLKDENYKVNFEPLIVEL